MNHIMVYDGTSMRPLGAGVNKPVLAMAFDENSSRLYVGGLFDSAGGRYSPMVAAVEVTAPAEVRFGNQHAVSRPVGFRVKNSKLAVFNAQPEDFIALYSPCGRRLLRAATAKRMVE
jgi:hypothetical protein